jgi:hypothetical protein
VALWKFILLRIPVERSYKADEGSHAGNGAEKQMIPMDLAIEREAAFSGFANGKFVADLQLVERGSQLAAGDKFKKEFEFRFIRRGNNRVGSLDVFVLPHDSKRGVLAGQKGNFRWRAHANGPQIFGDVSALHDSRGVEFLTGQILLILILQGFSVNALLRWLLHVGRYS